MTTEKDQAGCWICADVVNGYRISRRYYSYTMREAVRMFKEEMRKDKKQKKERAKP
jgi:hypothetical protein